MAERTKACSVCGVVKPFSEYTFDRRRATGRQACCLACTREWQHQYRRTNPDAVAASKRRDYLRRRNKILDYQREYAVRNADRIKEQGKARRANATPEDKRASRERSKRYADANRELVNARSREWTRRHPERAVDYEHARRARKYAVGSERIDVLKLADRDHWICGICTDPVDPTLTYPDRGYRSVDHVIPLSLGGSHTYENTRIAHLYCNVRRGAARGESLDHCPDASLEASG